MFDNLATVVIEIQHSLNLILIINEAHFLDDGLKLFELQVICLLGNQNFNNLFKVQPAVKKTANEKRIQLCPIALGSSINL